MTVPGGIWMLAQETPNWERGSTLESEKGRQEQERVKNQGEEDKERGVGERKKGERKKRKG